MVGGYMRRHSESRIYKPLNNTSIFLIIYLSMKALFTLETKNLNVKCSNYSFGYLKGPGEDTGFFQGGAQILCV
jgi:hypothetical protein